jgi:ribosome-associated protein
MDAFLLHLSIRAAAQADFSRSGGPGGQNVNKVNTKATLRINLDDLAGLTEAECTRLKETLASRITKDGELVIAAREERSQRINLERAYARMETLIASAAKLPKHRRPSRPGRAAREERLRAKKRQGLIKAERRVPHKDE